MKRRALFSAAAAVCAASTAQAVTVVTTTDAIALANATLAPSSGISIVPGSASLIGVDTQQGIYSGFNQTPGTTGTGRTLALTDGVVLTSGIGNFDTTKNTAPQATAFALTGFFQPLVDLATTAGVDTLQADTNVLSFEFVLDDPAQNAVTAQFIFATEEFPGFFFRDIMAIFVNGVNYAFFPDGSLVASQPGSSFNVNPVGTDATTGYGLEWNGLTDVLDVTMLANGQGAANLIEIAIADSFDSHVDSGLFFTNLAATTTTGGGGIGPDPSVIPLPAAGWMLLAGLGGLAAMRRRRTAE